MDRVIRREASSGNYPGDVDMYRPDSYIAYQSLSLNSEKLKKYLDKLFLRKSEQEDLHV
jgi:hypothetical protein